MSCSTLKRFLSTIENSFLVCWSFSFVVSKRIFLCSPILAFLNFRSCIDHIFVLRQILEQANEWHSTTYALFIDFEKAFDSVNRDALWKILRWHGLPHKIVNVIRALYEGFQCKVICGEHTSSSFRVQTGVKQGCVLSPTLFILAVDWLMNEATSDKRRGLKWTLDTVLETLTLRTTFVYYQAVTKICKIK